MFNLYLFATTGWIRPQYCYQLSFCPAEASSVSHGLVPLDSRLPLRLLYGEGFGLWMCLFGQVNIGNYELINRSATEMR